MKYYLSIDIGASSGRHILSSIQNGKLVLEEVYRFENGMTQKDGHLVWEYEKLFSNIIAGRANETVTYKIGGTYFEVSTACGGSEPLFEKMKRLIKSESVKTPTDKKEKVRYNKDSSLSVGRSLQEE